MNYRHLYHAGNFADVLKHLVLIALIQSLQRKEKPFFYLDTHAGIGIYNLRTEEAQKNPEFTNGIEKIYFEEEAPNLIKDYLNCIRQFNTPKTLSQYPGSPKIVETLLRSNDRMVLTELHPNEYDVLKKHFKNKKQISVLHQNGYQALKALLPPKEKRGLVFIDPPFELPNEFNDLPHFLLEGLKRWESGIYCIWYPIKNRDLTNRFLKNLEDKVNRSLLNIELCIYPEDVILNLQGSGLAIVNPPWQLEANLQPSLKWVWEKLSMNGKGHFSINSRIK